MDSRTTSVTIAAAELADNSRRLADRLRSLSVARLARDLTPGCSVAAAGLALAQRLADLSAGVEHYAAQSPPDPRPLPFVPDLAVGDVVSVTSQDLLTAAAALAPETMVWRDGVRADVAQSLADGAASCRSLRLAL